MWKPAPPGFVVHNLVQSVMHTWPLQMMLTPFVRIATSALACPSCHVMVILAKDANFAVVVLPAVDISTIH